MSNILIKTDIDPLCGMTANQVLEKIKEALFCKVEKAYYFGSFNTPSFNKYSDIDLILISNCNTVFVERPLEYSYLLDIVPNIDILVYTQTEFDRLINNPTAGFWKNAAKSLSRFI